MPIYAYRCQDCGFEKDELQKMSDAPLTVCPSCGTNGFARMLTAPAFQLKGSGWYVTDFRDGGGKKKPDGSGEGAAKDSGAKDSGSGDTAPGSSGSASSGTSGGGSAPDSKGGTGTSSESSKPAAAAPASSSSPAGGTGASA